VGNKNSCDVTTQTVWCIAKFMKRDEPRAPSAIYGLLCFKSHPLEKANAIADRLENQFPPHDLWDENHERQLEARVQALLETVDNDSSKRLRPCDLQKLMNPLKLRKVCGIDEIQINASGSFREDN
jgi:hypothetical protein